MHDNGKRLSPLSKVGWEVRKEFHTHMEARHPWLCLCDDHWKVDQIWSNHFSGWTLAGASKGKGPETLKRECSIEEDEAGPSEKRPKNLNQQRPRPKPAPRQVAKVSTYFHYIYIVTENTSRSTLCKSSVMPPCQRAILTAALPQHQRRD